MSCKMSSQLSDNVAEDELVFSEITRENTSEANEQFELKRTIGLAGGIAVISGTMVGSGIFVSPVGVLSGVNGSVGLSLVIWAACGVISSLASLCYCELGSSIRESGGEYAYLNKAYGPIAAFIFSWTSSVVTRTAGNAATAVTFGSYFVEAFFPGGCTQPDVIVKLTAAVLILTLAVINYVSVTASARLMQILAIAKFVAMGVIIVGGLVRLGQGDPVGISNLSNAFRPQDLAGLGFSQIGLAFYQGLWSYEGWNNLNYITEEVKNPKKNLPLSIVISVPLVTGFYILVNIAYFAALTPAEMLTSQAVAVTWGYRVLGSAGWIMPLSVCLSIIGALNGSFLTGGRLPFVAARRGHLPQILAMAQVKFYSPGPAIILTTVITLIFMIPNDFDALLNAFSFTAWLFYASVTAGVIVLRITHPDMPRPYKVPIVIPAVVLVIAIYLIVAPLVESPDIIILYAAIFIMCAPFAYYIFVHKQVTPPGMDRMTIFLQQLFDVTPTDWDKLA